MLLVGKNKKRGATFYIHEDDHRSQSAHSRSSSVVVPIGIPCDVHEDHVEDENHRVDIPTRSWTESEGQRSGSKDVRVKDDQNRSVLE